jgi:hypothetical protein
MSIFGKYQNGNARRSGSNQERRAFTENSTGFDQ